MNNLNEEEMVKTNEEEFTDENLSEDLKRKEHEDSEVYRKAEWEKKQKEKKYAELKALQEIHIMKDETVMSESLKKINSQTQLITRRNMKDCVSEYLQTKCIEDTEFARKTMHPRKNMINCFKYINRHALDFIKQEMENNGETPSSTNMGGDVPDELCYQWAEKYFLDMEAKEDIDKDEEFIPKTYYGSSSSKTKKKSEKKITEVKKPESKKEKEAETIQLSLEDLSA